MTFIGFLLIDDVKDRRLRHFCQLVPQPTFLVGKLLVGNLGQRLIEANFPLLDATVNVGIVACARGIHDVLLACQDVLDVAWQGTARAKQVDLEDKLVQAVVLIEQVL